MGATERVSASAAGPAADGGGAAAELAESKIGMKQMTTRQARIFILWLSRRAQLRVLTEAATALTEAASSASPCVLAVEPSNLVAAVRCAQIAPWLRGSSRQAGDCYSNEMMTGARRSHG